MLRPFPGGGRYVRQAIRPPIRCAAVAGPVILTSPRNSPISCHFWAVSPKSTGVNRTRSGWRGPGSRTGDPGCPGYRTGRPEKAGGGTRAQNRANKNTWNLTSATTEKLGQYAADRHGQRRFSLPLTPKYHGPKGYFFPLSNYSFEGSFRVVLRKSYVVFRPKLTPKT